jgi:hypothetical protein
MITNAQIDGYLLETGRQFSSPEENMWIIHSEDEAENIVVYRSPPVITFRVKLMDLPSNAQGELFKRLLEYNATEMVVGAYGLEDESIVIVDTLQLENLDLNELQASIDGISMAVAMHYSVLRQYQDARVDVQDERLAAFDEQLKSTQE